MTAIGFAISDAAGGVAHYRGAVPANMLRAAGHSCIVSDQLQQTPAGTLALAMANGDDPDAPHYAAEPDVLVLTGAWPFELPDDWVTEARGNGQRVFADVQDWPFVPPSNGDAGRHSPARLFALLDRCDGVVVATPNLATCIEVHCPTVPIAVAHNRVVRELFALPAMHNAARRANTDRERFGAPLVAAYRGGVEWHRDDIAQFPAAILTRSGAWRLRHIGDREDGPRLAAAWGLPDGDVTRRPLVPFRDYPSMLAGVDVGIVPLAGSPFSQAKSAIAALEWTAAGVPWVASQQPEFLRLDAASCVRRWRQWVGALEALRDRSYRAETLERQREAAARYGWNDATNAPAEWSRALGLTGAPKVAVEHRALHDVGSATGGVRDGHEDGRRG